MPNTLAHIGVQTLLARGLIRGADPKWILAGVVLPDIPWILQRALRVAISDVPPIDLRLYSIVQASLASCLVLAAAIALLTNRPLRVFAILALGALSHLILDALQTKWANGVHLLAPASWELWNAELFWPEDWPSTVLTLAGLATMLWLWRRSISDLSDFCVPDLRRAGAIVALLALYAFSPLALKGGPLAADNHATATLSAPEARTGRDIAFDRNRYDAKSGKLTTWTGEVMTLSGDVPSESGTVSLRGRFEAFDRIDVTVHHAHASGLRKWATLLGLLLILAFWLTRPVKARTRRR